MNIRFDGRTVAVTGAGHGFGRCIAQTFAHLGARVFATDISADELAETAAHGGILTKAAAKAQKLKRQKARRKRRSSAKYTAATEPAPLEGEDA